MFVTFEGPEGAGKSTAMRSVAAALEAEGRMVLVTREPGAGALGREVRRILLEGEEMTPLAEMFLFLADRAEHVAKIVRPALAGGKIVLCDRHADSTVVYQGHARGSDPAKLRELNLLATGGLVPDLTLLLDLPAEEGLRRLTRPDRLDREPLDFHQRVRQGFLAEAGREPARWRIIDASRAPQDVSLACLALITERLKSG